MMENKAHYFWKNFRLGTELQCAGSFIYNALYCLENMESFYWKHECFEFLYNASVGLERLEKIAVILLEHNDTISDKDFEKSLITHSHQELIKRIKAKRKSFTLNKQGNLLLELLQNFYNSARYDRFNVSSVFHEDKDQAGLVNYVSSQLKVQIINDLPFSTPIDDRIRKFLGKVIGGLAVTLYDLIKHEAHRLNMYTYEIVSASKGFKIFIAQQFDFILERRMQREVFLYLFKNMDDDNTKMLINQIEPIAFGQLSVQDYLQAMFSYHGDRQVLDEMETIEEEDKSPRNRIEAVMILGTGINIGNNDFE